MSDFTQEIEQNIHDMFTTSSELILTKSLSEAEFNLCVNTISITIDYLRAKRSKESEQVVYRRE